MLIISPSRLLAGCVFKLSGPCSLKRRRKASRLAAILTIISICFILFYERFHNVFSVDYADQHAFIVSYEHTSNILI
jgi:hypothetical protein